MIELMLSLTLIAAREKNVPVAMVVNVEGKALHHIEKGAGTRLQVFKFLHPGDQLSIEKGNVLLVFLADGRQERLKGPLKTTIVKSGSDPPGETIRKSEKEVVLTGLMRLHDGKRGAVTILRGPERDQPPPMTPMAGASVLSDKPTLSWQAKDTAVKYRITLGDADDEVIWRGETDKTTLKYPVKKPLDRERKYQWQVHGLDSAGKNVFQWRCTFYVLGKEKADQVDALSARTKSDDPNELLVSGLALFGHGLHDHALEAFERLARLAPDQAVHHVVLNALYERAGRPDEARAARRRAEKLGYPFADKSSND